MKKDLWNGFEIHRFNFENRDAIMVLPKTSEKKSALLLKTEYRDAFPDIEIRLAEQGFCLAYIKNKTRFATKEDCEIKARFVKYIAKTYNLAERCIPVGMSCGGAHAVNFAGFYPELIECMYIDAPVLMVYGTEDKTVEYSENGALLEDAYKNHPELLTVISVNCRGHHPHGMIGPNDVIVEYILDNAKYPQQYV